MALLRDAEMRQLMALDRRQGVAWAQEKRLERKLAEFERRERAVIAEPQRAGFLRRADQAR
jgi:hypothetical protein